MHSWRETLTFQVKYEDSSRSNLASSSSSSDGLVQICVTLSRWFLYKTAAFFTEQCTSLSLFQVWSDTRRFEPLTVERYVRWGCILNCFMLSSLPCFYAFCWLLSLHLVTFLMFFILVRCRDSTTAKAGKQCGDANSPTLLGWDNLALSFQFQFVP